MDRIKEFIFSNRYEDNESLGKNGAAGIFNVCIAIASFGLYYFLLTHPEQSFFPSLDDAVWLIILGYIFSIVLFYFAVWIFGAISGVILGMVFNSICKTDTEFARKLSIIGKIRASIIPLPFYILTLISHLTSFLS